MNRLVWACILVAPWATGCSYFANRGKDLGDVISIGISLGGSIQVRARPTRFLTLEVGAQKDEHYYGWSRRRLEWEESSYGLFLTSLWSTNLRKEASEAWSWWDLLRTSHTRSWVPPEPPLPGQKPPPGPTPEDYRYHLFVLTHAQEMRWVEALDVEVSAGWLIGGLQLTVRPGELLDFLVGLVGLDIAGDDEFDTGAESGADGSDRTVAPAQ
ncbi:MAG TPA: hypothetical protein VFD71_17625 [Planctomycetota bacterium]|jgi:hypothetical protein|nr:hypothetical protein [Planctomycetota bacterium]